MLAPRGRHTVERRDGASWRSRAFAMFETAAWARRRVLELRRDFTWAEASGSVGDLGTFVPIAVGLTVRSGLDIGTTLTMTGLYNLATAFAFDVPMPVQPMKAIAAVALADPSVDLPQILSAGLFVSLVVFALGVAGLIDRFNRLAPNGLVHGVQVGIGTLLCLKALRLFLLDQRGRPRPATGADGLILGACALAFAILAETRAPTPTATAPADTSADARRDSRDTVEANHETSPETIVDDASAAAAADDATRPPPTALALVLFGAFVAACRPGALASLRLGPSPARLVTITPDDLARGVFRAGLPQLPLTTLNSVVATCALTRDLFPDREASPRDVAASVGAMNAVGCALGAMPCCHGAGGMAAHYRFGARRGSAVAFLGACKLALGVVFGDSLLTTLRRFPEPVLGVLLLAASAELVRAGIEGFRRAVAGSNPDADVREIFSWRRADAWVLVATAAGAVATGNTGAGCALGVGAAAVADVLKKQPGWADEDPAYAPPQYRELNEDADAADAEAVGNGDGNTRA